MQLQFTDLLNGDTFTLGRVSFNFLDGNSVFDAYQENHDIASEIIFQTSKDKVKSLANDIRTLDLTDIREDISIKINEFANFIDTSNGIQALIR